MAEFHKQRLFIVIAAGVGLLSVFLPWAKVSFFGISNSALGIEMASGWLCLLAFVGAGALAFVGEKDEPIAEGKRMIFLIASGIAALVGIGNVFYFAVKDVVSPSIGVYLAFLAGAALVGIYFFVNDSGDIEMSKK